MNKSKSNILLIYTGGTIGMIKDFETGVLRAFDFKTLLEKTPELQLLDCSIDTVSFEEPIDSSNMEPSFWVEIAELIEANYSKFDGFVVLHGTDTMSYTASALSFMLENLAKPVVFTGSQLPLGDLRTDAKENLITSIQVASLKNDKGPLINEVCLYFGYRLYRANRTTKINVADFQAFASFNYPELAESGVLLKIKEKYLLKNYFNKALNVHKNLDNNIALIKLFPGISEHIIRGIMSSANLKAVIIETFGSGNCTTQDWFVNLLKEAIENGIQVVNVTQCSRGSVMMGHYETSSQLKKIGVITGKDMTTESAISKLMFMLGQKISPKLFKTAFETPLRGEMT